MEQFAYLLPFGKYIAATLALVLVYLLLFKDQSSYRSARMYLLSIVAVAWAIALPKITLFTPDAIVVERELEPLDTQISTEIVPMQPSKLFNRNELVVSPQPTHEWSVLSILSWIYMGVTALLLVQLFIQWFRLLALRRQGACVSESGMTIVASSKITTPFSFGRSIFINPSTNAQKLKLILEHERWHIRHRHYIDVLIAELSVRLFWFNPPLWWVRHELRNIHEYQVDRSLLDAGQDIYVYQTSLLEEVMDSSPILANGFNSSFIKKRFIKMKNGTPIRCEKLRKICVVPAVLLLFCLFSFSKGKAPIIYKDRVVESQTEPLVSINVVDEPTISDTITAKTDEKLKEIVATESAIDSSSIAVMNKALAGVTEAMIKILPVSRKKSTTLMRQTLEPTEDTLLVTDTDGTQIKMIRRYEDNPKGGNKRAYYRQIETPFASVVAPSKSKYQFKESHNPNINRELLVSQLLAVETTFDMTIVTVAVPVPEHGQMVRFSSQYMLIDRRNASQPYRIKGLSGGYPLNEVMSLSGYEGKFVEFKLIFPAIASSVKTIDLTEPSSTDDFGHLSRFSNINLKQLRNQKKAEVIR